MFGGLTEKLGKVFSKLARAQVMTEENVAEAVKEVRFALLEADVNFTVTKNFIKRVREKAVGEKVLKSISAAQQFVKIVHDELVALMGVEEARLDLAKNPAIILLCGLQGSGKTTQAAKLAKFLMGKTYQRKPLLVACDLQRPAAIDQLESLGKQIGVPVFAKRGEKSAEKVAKEALEQAKVLQCDLIIVDTAGRLHIDTDLMEELKRLKAMLRPSELLFVANATTGQDAVTMAQAFNEAVDVTGTILTMLDSNARAGAALSIREVTGKPLKFEGVGEKVDDFHLFHPRSMADRILGMGDTINLVKKAQEHFEENNSKEMEAKLKNATFTFDDYLSQMQQMKKLGPLKSLLKMMPGASQLPDMDEIDGKAKLVEAIISSMTREERAERVDLTPSRRRRIATGSGVSIDEVNRLIKGFRQTKQFIKGMPSEKKLFEKMKTMGDFKPWH